jgi:hypothetical protein
VAICASNIDHHAGQGSGDVRGMRGVPLECAIRHAGTWTELTTVVDGKDQWAAWIHALEVSSSDPSAFVASYKRDFSFQFLNLGAAGRPSTDGVYTVEIRVKDGALVTGPPSKTTEPIWDPTDVTQEEWEPTAAELQEYAPYIKKSEGPCPPPNGCPQP